MAAERRGHTDRLASGQHFIRSSRLAAELVAAACVCDDDAVVELGAGFGRLTIPLARTAGRVTAVEIAPDLASGLRRRFGGDQRVDVVEGDALVVPFPRQPFRAFGNIPFAHTSGILRRLLDPPDSALQRADLIVAEGVARKCCSARPCSMRTLGWLPWWRFALERHILSAAFDPRPSVDAAMVSMRRREQPLLHAASADHYRAMLRRAFDGAPAPLRRTLRLPPRAWKSLAHERGLPVEARPQQLDVWDWLAVFERLC